MTKQNLLEQDRPRDLRQYRMSARSAASGQRRHTQDMIAQVLIELLPTSSGGLKKSQASGTRSLLYKFEVGGEPIAFGGFLDLDDSAMITPGLGPVHGTITFWAQEARALKAGDRFEIVYPIRPVGHGHIESISQPGL